MGAAARRETIIYRHGGGGSRKLCFSFCDRDTPHSAAYPRSPDAPGSPFFLRKYAPLLVCEHSFAFVERSISQPPAVVNFSQKVWTALDLAETFPKNRPPPLGNSPKRSAPPVLGYPAGEKKESGKFCPWVSKISYCILEIIMLEYPVCPILGLHWDVAKR